MAIFLANWFRDGNQVGAEPLTREIRQHEGDAIRGQTVIYGMQNLKQQRRETVLRQVNSGRQ